MSSILTTGSNNRLFSPTYLREGTMRPQTIIPQKIYPIGEFADGSRLCASVEAGREVNWFPEHRDFDYDDSEDPWVIQLSEEDIPTLRDEEVQELLDSEVQTLTDEEVEELLGIDLPIYREWN